MQQKEFLVKATSKYERISPKKVREVARVIVGKPVSEALDLLQFIPRKAARLLRKTLQSAIANAENNNNIYSESLVVKNALANQGPTFRRFRPAARGMAHPYKKHTTHIEIQLSEEKKA